MPEQVGQEGEAPQEITPQASEPTPESSDFDVDDLFARGTATIEMPADGDVPPEPVADADDLEADEPEETPDEGGDSNATEKPDQQAQLFQYAATVAQNPTRIAEVPRKMQPEVIKQLLAAAYTRGRDDTSQTFEQQSSQEERLRVLVSEKDDLRRSDPDAFLTWEDEHPEEAAQYRMARKTFSERRAGPVETPQQATPDLIQKRVIDRLLPRVQSLPEGVRAQIQQRVNAGEFPLTDAGYDALDEAIFRASTQVATAPAPASDPETRAAVERRQQAAQTRSAAAKPVGIAGAGASRQVDSYDPDELFALAGSVGR